MNIWITGARGFIGRHLASFIGSQNNIVIGIGHGHWVSEDYKSWNLSEWLNGDITSQNLDLLVQKYGTPDVIFHLAGGSSVGPSFEAPVEDMKRSVLSTSNLLEWVRLRSPATPIVMASSAAVYGAQHTGPISENVHSVPFSPYGFHKRMSELLMESYAQNFGLQVAVVRLFSVYGPGLKKQLLWDACTKLSEQENQITFGGSGTELRDWVSVKDVAQLLWHAKDYASDNGFVLNCGTGKAVTVKQIVEELSNILGNVNQPLFSGVSRKGDPKSLVAETSKLSNLGVKPQDDWKSGLLEYVNWFKENKL